MYGTVLPWANEPAEDGPVRMWDVHENEIGREGAEWEQLRSHYPSVPLLVAGDFNQDRDGSGWYGSRRVARPSRPQRNAPNSRSSRRWTPSRKDCSPSITWSITSRSPRPGRRCPRVVLGDARSRRRATQRSPHRGRRHRAAHQRRPTPLRADCEQHMTGVLFRVRLRGNRGCRGYGRGSRVWEGEDQHLSRRSDNE